MKENVIHGAKYDIIIGGDLSERLKSVIDAPGTYLITDSNVERLYGGQFGAPRYVLNAGEESKKLINIGRICGAMLEAGCDRKTSVVALGGGVVGDVAGFAASVYMRGVKVIQVPTTLLAMADSSIGGKTGVNAGAKNIIGTFHQPSAVMASLKFLKTLPQREIICGMGEVFKTALLDKNIYAQFKRTMSETKAGREGFTAEPERLYDIIGMCAAFKLDIVTRDEKEDGLRKILNAGHTLGHALEVYDKYRLSHGEYVIHGIALETEIAKDIGLIDPAHYEEVKRFCAALTGGESLRFSGERLVSLCAGDKKNRGGGISIVLSYAPGKTEEVFLKSEELVKTLKRIKAYMRRD